jgi:hypothetical protein
MCASGRAAAQEGPEVPRVRAGALGDLAVDGRLDEPVWQGAEVIESIRQSEPDEGAPATVRTVARVLANARGIAVGIVCDDLETSYLSTGRQWHLSLPGHRRPTRA